MTGEVTERGRAARVRLRGTPIQLLLQSFAAVVVFWVVGVVLPAIGLLRPSGEPPSTVELLWLTAFYGGLGLVFFAWSRRPGIELRSDSAIVRGVVRRRTIHWTDVVDVADTQWGTRRIVLVTADETVVVGRFPYQSSSWWDWPTDPRFEEKLALVRRWWLDHGGVERPAPPDHTPGALGRTPA